jgi:hypothetical protein
MYGVLQLLVLKIKSLIHKGKTALFLDMGAEKHLLHNLICLPI